MDVRWRKIINIIYRTQPFYRFFFNSAAFFAERYLVARFWSLLFPRSVTRERANLNK